MFIINTFITKRRKTKKNDITWTLKVKTKRQDLIELFQIYKGLSRVETDELFVLDENMKVTRGHCL